MSESILYDAAVTSEDLQNIAVDLGSPEFTFGETKFGADALNGITAAMVNAGVLNTLNKCNVTVSGGTAYVDTGIIVFSSGAKMKITEPVGISLLSGSSYLYAKHDVSLNKIYITNSAEAPSGDYVMLAEISDGAVTLRRTFATGKATFAGGNMTKTVELSGSVTTEKNNGTALLLAESIDLEGVEYNYIIIERSGDFSEVSTTLNFARYDISKNIMTYLLGKTLMKRSESNRVQLDWHQSNSSYAKVLVLKIEDGKLNLYLCITEDYSFTVNIGLSGLTLTLA